MEDQSKSEKITDTPNILSQRKQQLTFDNDALGHRFPPEILANVPDVPPNVLFRSSLFDFDEQKLRQ